MRTDTARSRGYSPGTPSSCGPLRRPSGALPNSVVSLSLRRILAYTLSPFTLRHSALPHIEVFRSVHMDPNTLCEEVLHHSPRAIGRADLVPPQVIATRLVQGFSLSLFSEHGYRALEALARTSTPVRRFTILIVDASAPNELFPQLAARLPQLEAPHIVALVQHYNLVHSSLPPPLSCPCACRKPCS